nr:EOG090X0N7H [Moina brachiata]
MSYNLSLKPLYTGRLLRGLSSRLYSASKATATLKTGEEKSQLKNPYLKDPVHCILCKYGVKVDYKNTRLLSQFLSPFTGKVYDQSMTGLCSEQQKRVEAAIKQAQTAGYLAVMLKKVEYKDDPVISNMSRRRYPRPG